MVSRRRTLRIAAGALAGAAGCLGDRDGSTPGGSPSGSPATMDDETPDDDPTPGDDDTPDGPVTTPGEVPEWRPEWTLTFEGRSVLGLDAADGLLYATLAGDGASAVAAVDPREGAELWRTPAEGGAVAGSHAADRGIARGKWGVTPAGAVVYAVAGPADDNEWSALHALDRSTGERRWSLRRERELAVAGVADGLVVATGLEFFPGEGETPVGHETPAEPLVTEVYGVDAADGTVRWTREFAGVADATTGPGGAYVAADDRLVALGRDGATRFTYARGPATRVVAGGDRVYYLTGEDEGATVHGVAPGGGADWTRSLPVGELLVDGGRLYAAGDDVAAVAPDGTVAWRDGAHGQWLLTDPAGRTLYTRAGGMADRATAYDAAAGDERFTFAPPSSNAWPEAATDDAVAVTAITPESGAFNTVYAVDGDGRATAAMERETVFDALGLDGTVYLADGQSRLGAYAP